MRNNVVSRMTILFGLVVLVLSVCGLISLVMVSLLMFALYLFSEPDFAVVFKWIGMPLTIFLSVRWIYRNYDYVKRCMDGR